VNTSDKRLQLAERIRRAFPGQPVPPYPPLMGLDPPGHQDEYAGFADLEWTQVPPHNFRDSGYDISPAIGFLLPDSPHMWNYYMPGFMSASLLHDAEHEVSDGFMWRLRDLKPDVGSHDPALPWWGGDRLVQNYTREQNDCVVAYLRYMHEFGADDPHYFVWGRADDRTLRRWLARS
tara:strand:- start:1849 stop:2379 length:531 start_codon:yes stop_codon:yes gene_type:complete